jgi:hypothetical protein
MKPESEYQHTPHEIELENSLKDSDIAIHIGGFTHHDTLGLMFDESYRPAVAIWGQSKIPNETEVETMVDLAKTILSSFGRTKNLSAVGINTITLFKKDEDKWTYRRLTWNEGPIWHPQEEPLTDIKSRIIRR